MCIVCVKKISNKIKKLDYVLGLIDKLGDIEVGTEDYIMREIFIDTKKDLEASRDSIIKVLKLN